jgi:hypothetical protein
VFHFKDMHDVVTLPYFHGFLSSDATNSILKPKGFSSFLIRFSSMSGEIFFSFQFKSRYLFSRIG